MKNHLKGSEIEKKSSSNFSISLCHFLTLKGFSAKTKIKGFYKIGTLCRALQKEIKGSVISDEHVSYGK